MRLECRTLLFVCLAAVFVTSSNGRLSAQQATATSGEPSPGDQPDDPGPLASDLSPALHSKAIRAAMKRVADWELARVQAQPPSRSWDFGALDIGLLAASRTLHDGRYSNYVVSVGDHFAWKLERTNYPANDFAIAQAFLELSDGGRKTERMTPTRRQFDDAMSVLNDPNKPAWWWCDALFMAPAAGMELTGITGDDTYENYVNREWDKTEKQLYDRQKHLFSRDASYLDKHEKNGEKVFWSRGNGWVMAALARVLATMQPDDPMRGHYVELLRQMAAAIASLQGNDGLWRPGLLDSKSYPLPEVSGSAFFIYALAWGIEHRMLDSDKYLPVVERGWAGLVAHIYKDGRLGSIQPIGEAPEDYKPSSSYDFGVGAFLLAGSELDMLSEHKHW